MKRLLITLLILLFALPAYAQQCSEETPCPELARLMVVGAGVPAVAGCTTSSDTDLVDYWTDNLDDAGLNTTTTTWGEVAITLTAGSTITEYVVQSEAEGGLSGTASVSLYTDSSGSPGTQVAGTEKTRAINTLATDPDDEVFTLATPQALGGDTAYHVVFKCTSGETFRVYRDTSVTGKTSKRSTDGGANWATTYSNSAFRVIVRGCTP